MSISGAQVLQSTVSNSDIMFMPMSLRELSERKVIYTLNDARVIEQLPLPLSVRRHLRSIIKELWKSEGPLMDINTFPYENVDIEDMSRVQFNMVINHPLDVKSRFPHFYLNRIIYDFYIWDCPGQPKKYLCKLCYERCKVLSEEEGLFQWGCSKDLWNFEYCREHEYIRGDEILNRLIWPRWHESNFYCELCIVRSLFTLVETDVSDSENSESMFHKSEDSYYENSESTVDDSE